MRKNRLVHASFFSAGLLFAAFLGLGCEDDADASGLAGAKDTVRVRDTVFVSDTAEARAKGASLEIRFHPVFGDQPLRLGRKYADAAGDSVRFSQVRFYVSEAALVDSLGAARNLPGLGLMDLAETAFDSSGHVALKTRALPGRYRGLRFSVGVPFAENHRDAAEQEAPLGPNSGMFWSWNSGYIFHRLEGRVDVADSSLPFFYHIGGDNRKMTVGLFGLPSPMGPSASTSYTVLPDSGNVFSVTVDYAKLFSRGLGASGPLRPAADSTERMTHGGPLADRIFLNLQTAFSRKN